MDQRERLNKLIARSGLTSRRGADALIAAGGVTVNGRRVFELGVSVGVEDVITVNGRPLPVKHPPVYYAFHKPRGVVSTLDDPQGRPCLKDYVRRLPARVFPLGRLDWDADGLLILTNDGGFAEKVMKPEAGVPKTYLVKVDGELSEERLEKLRRGVSIPAGGKVRAQSVDIVRSGPKSWVRLVITEGKNHQVKHMMAKIGCDVVKLKRVAIGQLKLGGLPQGGLKPLSRDQATLALNSKSPFVGVRSRRKYNRPSRI